MAEVTDFPDLSVLKLLPNWCQIRIGDGVFCLYNPDCQIHVDIALASLEPRAIAPMLNNLFGAMFEREFPGMWTRIVQAEAVAAARGTKIRDRELFRAQARLRQLEHECRLGGELPSFDFVNKLYDVAA